MMVSAYTEFNLGDDLFIKVLCERYPDTRFMIIAPVYISWYSRISRTSRSMLRTPSCSGELIMSSEN